MGNHSIRNPDPTLSTSDSVSNDTSRVTADILKDLCNCNPRSATPKDRLPHDCYMITIGHLRSEHLMKLKEMNESHGIKSFKEEDENQSEYSILSSENVESILEYMAIDSLTEQLQNQRKRYFVYEDNFNSALIDLIKANSSFEKLKQVCSKF
ncbi:hypothetical protein I4U23_023692 [Adineta vaga]|nr:hypothetical protein I4U23_023692 [Adineta vaga]